MADITCKDCGTIINIKRAKKGVVICPNCDVENDCSEQIYTYASGLMASAGNEVSYKAAAEAFSLIEGYRDADMYRENCLEQASVCFKDATFLRAKTEMMKGDRAGLSFAIHLLESISGWKDADEQLDICKMRLEALAGKGHDGSGDSIYNSSNKGFIKKDRVSLEKGKTRVKNSSDETLSESEKPVIKKSKVKQSSQIKESTDKGAKKKMPAIINASSIGVVLIGALVTVYFLIIAPMLKYDDAIELINSGNFADGYAILTELGKEDDIKNNKHDRAVSHIEKKEYNKAYALFYEIGEEDLIADNIISRVSSSVASSDFSEAVRLLESNEGILSLPEKRYNAAVKALENGSYDEAYILLANNSYEGSEQKRKAIINVSSDLMLLGKQKGDVIELGALDTDGDEENKADILKWKIIDETDDAYLVLCEDVIDCLPFDYNTNQTSWNSSYVRKMLNLSIYNSAFNKKEQEVILEKSTLPSRNPSYDTDPGKEALNPMFLPGVDELNKLVNDKKVKSKKYEESESGMCWWLRTPGAEPGTVCFVDSDGNINLEGAPANTLLLVRPAMWVKKI